MGALREKMIEEMKLRNFASRTQKSYVAAMVGLARHYHRFPDQLTQDEIRSYLLHLKERGLSPSSRNVAIAGGVKSEGSRALALRPRQASRPLLADDGLCHGASCERVGPAQSERHRQ